MHGAVRSLAHVAFGCMAQMDEKQKQVRMQRGTFFFFFFRTPAMATHHATVPPSSKLSQLSRRVTVASDRVAVTKHVVETLKRRVHTAESERESSDAELAAGFEEDVRRAVARPWGFAL